MDIYIYVCYKYNIMETKIIEELAHNTKNTCIQEIIFFGDEKYLKNIWYNRVKNFYMNILRNNGYNVSEKDMLHKIKYISQYKQEELELVVKSLDQYIKKGILCIFTPVNFAILMHIYLYSNINGRKNLESILKKLKYIILWQEIIQDNLMITGYDPKQFSKKFLILFFESSILNLISNMQSFKTLKKYNLKNCQYYTIIGHSKINNIIPLTQKTSTIDILIYGSRIKSNFYEYRTMLVDKITDLNKKFNYSLVMFDDTFEIDKYLECTNIVVHVPSFSNLPHMPWAKITTLQAKKVFFIIEENDEMYEKQLETFTIYYQRNDIEDLYKKIAYFLDPVNQNEKQRIIEENYDYIMSTNNMDIKIPEFISTIIL